ncbi:hypothetical protein BH11ACT2_BH11ACT2_11160 [soil metagenome]
MSGWSPASSLVGGGESTSPVPRRHLNAAGASLQSTFVLDTVVEQLRLESRLGGYDAAAAQREALDAVYAKVGRLIGVQADDIALVESATVGWQRLVGALRLAPGSRVLASRSTYVSMALSLLELRRSHGIVVELLPTDETGGVDLEALSSALSSPAAMVTVSHVPTSSGLIEPIAKIGALARAAGVPFVLDATQSVGQLQVDAAAASADAIFATGRKFLRAPRGTGFLYVSPQLRDSLVPLDPDVRGAEWTADADWTLSPTARKFETWEASHALRLGLGAALDELEAVGIDVVSRQIGGLASRLRERLSSIPGVVVVDPPAAEGSGIVTFVAGEDPRATLARLAEARIHALAVPASHGQWDLGARGIERVVRASVHVYNDDSDIDAVEAVLRGGVRGGRSTTTLPDGSDIPDVSPAPRSPSAASGRVADVVVIGAGIHGRATARSLAERGLSVMQLEQYGPAHTEGSSHGTTRMIRRAYPNAIWDDFVDTAFGAWDELSEHAASPLVSVVGGLFSRPDGSTGSLRGPGCVLIDRGDARALFPGLSVPEGYQSLYDPRAGIIRADSAMETLERLGVAAGVVSVRNARVLGWSHLGDGVLVQTTDGPISAGSVVVCAGPWTGQLLPEFAPKLGVVRIVNAYIGSSQPQIVSAPQLGVFSVELDNGRLLYGFPSFGGRDLKVGFDDGPTDDLSAPRRAVTAAEEQQLLAASVPLVRGADGAVVDSLSCRYTMAPNNRFAIGAVPGRENVFVAAACSGHGFKFGPAIGSALADLVTGVERPDLGFLAPALMLAE